MSAHIFYAFRDTYIHNWPLQPFSQYYGLASHTTHIVCVLILYMNGGTYSLKSIRNYRFLRNFSWQFNLLSAFLPEICWELVAEEIFFHISIWHLTKGLNLGLTSNKPAHYLLDYRDFRGQFCLQMQQLCSDQVPRDCLDRF